MQVGVVSNTMGNDPAGCVGDLTPVHQAQDIPSHFGCVMSLLLLSPPPLPSLSEPGVALGVLVPEGDQASPVPWLIHRNLFATSLLPALPPWQASSAGPEGGNPAT